MIKFENEAKASLFQGIETLALAVKYTLGPNGRNVLIDNDGKPYITKDGVTVAKNVKLEDHFLNIGAELLRSVATKTCDEVGDATTTSIVLTYNLIKAGLDMLQPTNNVVLVKDGMTKALDCILDCIKKQAKPIESTDQLISVATISANNDEVIGSIIGEAMDKVNRKGIITVDPSDTTETYVEVIEGFRFDQGYMSPYFVNNKARMIVEFQDPKILTFRSKIKTLKSFTSEITNCISNSQPLVIICPDIESEILNQLVYNQVHGSLKVCVVKAPGFAEYQQDQIRDIRHICSLNTEDSEMSVGFAKKVVVTKEETTIIGGECNKEDLQHHIMLLKANLQGETFESNRLKLRERLARLEGGAAIIHVGALSEVEMLEKKDRIDDALSATRSSLEAGVVIGGGYSLLNCLPELLNLDYNNEDEKLGIDIVLKAISKPNEAILNNAGLTKPEIDYNLKNTTGLNVRTKQVEDLMASGVIDSAKVVMSAITNSITVSSMFLTIECAIINRFEVIEKNAQRFC